MIQGLNERLKEQRKKVNLTQLEVANILNTSKSMIARYESGERTPSLEMLMSLSSLYHCSTDYLLGLNRTNNVTFDTSNLSDKQINVIQDLITHMNTNKKQ